MHSSFFIYIGKVTLAQTWVFGRVLTDSQDKPSPFSLAYKNSFSSSTVVIGCFPGIYALLKLKA